MVSSAPCTIFSMSGRSSLNRRTVNSEMSIRRMRLCSGSSIATNGRLGPLWIAETPGGTMIG
jgi:hypothetical protein